MIADVPQKDARLEWVNLRKLMNVYTWHNIDPDLDPYSLTFW